MERTVESEEHTHYYYQYERVTSSVVTKLRHRYTTSICGKESRQRNAMPSYVLSRQAHRRIVQDVQVVPQPRAPAKVDVDRHNIL